MYLGFGVVPFPNITKKNIRVTLYCTRGFTGLPTTIQESTRIYRVRSAFLAGSTLKSVQFFGYSKEKQKRFISICYLISCLLCVFCVVLMSPSQRAEGYGLLLAKIRKILMADATDEIKRNIFPTFAGSIHLLWKTTIHPYRYQRLWKPSRPRYLTRTSCLCHRKVTALECGEHALRSHRVEATKSGMRFQFGK